MSRPTSCLRSARTLSGRDIDRLPMKSLRLLTIQSMPRSSGVTVPSVSWPAMMKPFSALSTCMVSVPNGVMPYLRPAFMSTLHSDSA